MKGLRSRGAFIVFEGCDRSGKTTQVQRVIKHLNEGSGDKTEVAKMMRFPDRTTQIGQMIDRYLKGSANLDDHVIHLLFSTNRWEKVADLRKTLESGTHVIVDRYAFSGVAFSGAKPNLSMEWCRQSDRGLPKPDLVCFLDVSAEEAAKRGGFGDERYEKAEFQQKVRQNYNLMMDPEYWTTIDTDGKHPDKVFEEILTVIGAAIKKPKEDELGQLWPIQD